MEVFYLDDDIDEVLLFSEALHELDPQIKCECTTDSIAGLSILQNGRSPDVIFLDYNMPGLTGEECLASIHTMDHLRKVPVIIYSTGVDELMTQRLLKKGAAMVVKKHATAGEFKSFFASTFIATPLKINGAADSGKAV